MLAAAAAEASLKTLSWQTTVTRRRSLKQTSALRTRADGSPWILGQGRQDFKSINVQLTAEGHAKLAEVGLAKVASRDYFSSNNTAGAHRL